MDFKCRYADGFGDRSIGKLSFDCFQFLSEVKHRVPEKQGGKNVGGLNSEEKV